MFLLPTLFQLSVPPQSERPAEIKVQIGAQLLIEKHQNLLSQRRVGLICNHTSVLQDGRHLADILYESPSIELVALFGPEHGIRGNAPDGESVQHGLDTNTQVPIYSLFGETNKPTPEMLNGIDLLLFDIQDIGARFYTYISTLSLAMEAAAEHSIPFVVLDRPNPIRGDRVEGPLREESLCSFFGLHPLPIVHGMTVGELAMMFNGEGWLKGGIKTNLRVIQMKGWKREWWYDETGLPWIKPSPSMLTMRTAVVYPGTCLIEGTNVSEGRGTSHPFENLGAPWISGEELAETLNAASLPGISFKPIEFRPINVNQLTIDPKFEGELCRGIYLDVKDRNIFHPVATSIVILCALKKLYPNHFAFRDQHFDLLAGVSWIRQMINEGAAPEEIIARWAEDTERFRSLREKYLIY
jgi:uncharacterized protein YbbC (DUF1343 family)